MVPEFAAYLGCQLDNTIRRLKKRYESTEIISSYTEPPGNKRGQGSKRVIAIKPVTEKKIKVIWSYQDYS